jgi:hypothetical protein
MNYGDWDLTPVPARETRCYTCDRKISAHERRRRVVDGQELCHRCCYALDFKIDPIRLP